MYYNILKYLLPNIYLQNDIEIIDMYGIYFKLYNYIYESNVYKKLSIMVLLVKMYKKICNRDTRNLNICTYVYVCVCVCLSLLELFF
jgi:hypothetical protein